MTSRLSADGEQRVAHERLLECDARIRRQQDKRKGAVAASTNRSLQAVQKQRRYNSGKALRKRAQKNVVTACEIRGGKYREARFALDALEGV